MYHNIMYIIANSTCCQMIIAHELHALVQNKLAVMDQVSLTKTLVSSFPEADILNGSGYTSLVT